MFSILGGGGYEDFPLKKLSHSIENFTRRTLVLQKVSGIENIMHQRITIFLNILSQSTEHFCTRNLPCFRKFPVSKNFMIQMGISRFSFGNLLSHSTEKTYMARQHFCLSEFFCKPKISWLRGGGGIKIFLQKICLTVSKNLEDEHWCCRKFLIWKT